RFFSVYIPVTIYVLQNITADALQTGRCGHRPLQLAILQINKINIVGQGLAPAAIPIIFRQEQAPALQRINHKIISDLQFVAHIGEHFRYKIKGQKRFCFCPIAFNLFCQAFGDA
ncbi:MAG: hypothetical protein ACI4RS_02535, partial [Monoglobaceae bacterium]